MKGKNVLITGINGFVGSHLAEYLLSKNLEIYGTIRHKNKTDNINHIKDKLKLKEVDVMDFHSLEKIIKEVEPDYIFHLIAKLVPMSWEVAIDTFEINVIGTLHLFEAVRELECAPIILIAGSSEEYGMVYRNEIPIKETNIFRPLSPYGVSKVAQDRLAYQYHKAYGLKTIITRAFNHEGPKRKDVFAASNFAKQIAEIEKGLREPVVYVGNLKVKRDFTDVRDVVKAYWLAVTKCKFGEAYNICSEKARSLQSVLSLLLSMSEVRNIKVRKDFSRLKKCDAEIIVGDCSKFKEATGWILRIPFEKTMKDLLDYWRERV